jgi:hypothetical protein
MGDKVSTPLVMRLAFSLLPPKLAKDTILKFNLIEDMKIPISEMARKFPCKQDGKTAWLPRVR